MGRVGSRERRQGGQALMEFALVIPIFLVMLIGMVDVGRAVWANNALANAAREGARHAIVHGGSKSNLCPVGPPGPLTVIPAASSTCPHPSPSKDSIRTVVRQFLVGAGDEVAVTVCYGTGCSGDTDAIGATNERGTPVTVQVSSRVSTIVGTLLHLGTFDLDATSTMLVNH